MRSQDMRNVLWIYGLTKLPSATAFKCNPFQNHKVRRQGSSACIRKRPTERCSTLNIVDFPASKEQTNLYTSAGEDDDVIRARIVKKKLQKRFSQLLKAARSRDRKLLVATIKKMERDEDIVMSQRLGSKDSVRLQDALLKACSRCDLVDMAERVFQDMISRDQAPTMPTGVAFMEAYRKQGNVEKCREIMEQLISQGVEFSGSLGLNVYVGALASAKRYNDAMRAIETATKYWNMTADAVSYNTIIGVAARNGNAVVAQRVYELMLEANVSPDVVTANCLINAEIQAKRYSSAQQLFESVLNGGFKGVEPAVITFNCGINAYAKTGNVDRGLELLAAMRQRGLQPAADTYNSLLSAMQRLGQVGRAMDLFYANIVGNGDGSIQPTRITYNIVLDLLRTKDRSREARRLYKQMVDSGISPDSKTLTALARVQEDAAGVYRVLSIANEYRITLTVNLINSIIRSLGEHADALGACRVFDQMRRAQVTPDRVSYNSLLYALASIGNETVDPLLSLSRRGGSVQPSPDLDSEEDTPVINGASLIQDVDDNLLEYRLASMTGVQAALLVLSMMKCKEGVGVDQFSYTTVVSSVARSGYANGSKTIETCNDLLTEAIEAGVGVNGQLCNAVLQGFGADYEAGIEFWKVRLRPLLRSSSAKGSVLSNLFRGYTGLLYICGKAKRPDSALKVIYAMRRDGLNLSPEVSSAYFNAKGDAPLPAVGDKRKRPPGALKMYLEKQFEELLVIECGTTKKRTESTWFDEWPNIRIKW